MTKTSSSNKVFPESRDVVSDPADAELSEAGEVFPDLSGVQMELLCQFVGRDGFLLIRLENGQAAKVDGESCGRELGDRLSGDPDPGIGHGQWLIRA
jgi:hypothetical protein